MTIHNRQTKARQRKRYKEKKRLQESRNKEDRMCRRKVTYAEQVTAMSKAAYYSWKYGITYKWYKCDICGKYHLSSKVGTVGW